jgi:hypothetical protein
MPLPRKDGFDTFLDFVFGAAGTVIGTLIVLAVLARFRIAASGMIAHGVDLGMVLFPSVAILGGALAALYRSDFWSYWEGDSLFGQPEQRLSLPGRIILWGLAAIGFAGLVWFLYLVFAPAGTA